MLSTGSISGPPQPKPSRPAGPQLAPASPRQQQPLLFPPPSPPVALHAPYHSQPPSRKSRLRICLAFTPLIFIAAVLGFAFYGYVVSLCLLYLPFWNAVPKAAVFLWLWGGCAGSAYMTYQRGGGAVNGSERRTPRDEEESVGRTGGSRRIIAEETRAFAVGTASEEEEEDDESDSDGEAGDTLLPRTHSVRGSGRRLEARSARARSRPEGGAKGGRGVGIGDALRTLERVADQEDLSGSVQAKSDGKVRYCRKCFVLKPDRAHHCSTCGVCVLKMDHHCPWMGGGCIGWANYKFFILFLLYGGFLGLYVGFSMMWELARFVESGNENYEMTPISWAILMLLGLIFGFALTLFGAYHFYLACTNRTTIEAMESPASFIRPPPPPAPPSSSPLTEANHSPPSRPLKNPASLTRMERRRLEKAGRRWNVYDVGVKRNLKSVFGGWEERWKWIFPVGWPPGDGTSFPINEDNLAQLQRVTLEVLGGTQRDHHDHHSQGTRFGPIPALPSYPKTPSQRYGGIGGDSSDED